MNKLRLLSLALLAALSSPAAADDPAIVVKAPDQPAKKICVRENTVGTRLAPVVCLTREQWKQREHADDDLKDRLRDHINRQVQDRPMPGTPAGSGG
jgi:hypothetical protein